VGARLLAPDLAIPQNAAATVLAQQAGCEDMDGLLHTLTQARQGVARDWAAIFGEPLETHDD
jgi:[glutamine synthetase] adenylyltransferase / [glutamine synthetase]-adenylyl-L-tyrosine phosphorylase